MKNLLKKKVRESNFELLRLFAMLGVVTSHFNYHSAHPDISSGFDFNFLLMNFLSVGAVANLIFIILTGYFMVKSRPNFRKIIGLLLEMYFYSLLTFAAVKLFDPSHSITMGELKATFLPFPFGNWFCVYYILLYLLTPALNHLIGSLKKIEFRRLLVVCLVIVSLIPSFLRGPTLSNLAVFIAGYLIGGYIQLYTKKGQKKSLLSLLLGLTVLTTLAAVSVTYLLFRAGVFSSADSVSYFLARNHSIFPLTIAIFIFLIFREIKIKPNRLINRLAGSVLGVYLIHDNVFTREYLWKKLFVVDINTISPIALIGFGLTKILVIFTTCLAIDQLRILLLGRYEIWLSDKIYTYLARTFAKVKIAEYLK